MTWKLNTKAARPPAPMVILLAVGGLIGAFAGRAFVRPEPIAVNTAERTAEPRPADGARIELGPEAERNAGLAITVATSRPVAETIRANGQFLLNEDRTWHVSSLTEGKVMDVRAHLGDYVKQGQVLAYLHSHDVHATRGAYRTAIAERDRAKAAEELARRVDTRAQRLLALAAVSREAAEQAHHDVVAAETAVRKADADVEKERQHMTEVLEISPDAAPGSSGVDPDLVPLKAPASGVVVRRFVSTGSVLTPGAEAFTVADPSSLWLVASVNEADLAQVHPGMTARMTVRAYPDAVFTGRVLQLGEELDPTTRTLKVRIAAANVKGQLKPEMFASVELERASAQAAVFLPETAAQEVNGQRVVFVETAARKYEARPVRVASVVDGQMRIEEGIRNGDRVVTAGSFALKSEMLKASLH